VSSPNEDYDIAVLMIHSKIQDKSFLHLKITMYTHTGNKQGTALFFLVLKINKEFNIGG
jgi:hypothetical protein